jgi:hypothetical protein
VPERLIVFVRYEPDSGTERYGDGVCREGTRTTTDIAPRRGVGRGDVTERRSGHRERDLVKELRKGVTPRRRGVHLARTPRDSMNPGRPDLLGVLELDSDSEGKRAG